MRIKPNLMLALLLAATAAPAPRPKTCRCPKLDLDDLEFGPDGVRCRRCGCPPPEPGTRGAA